MDHVVDERRPAADVPGTRAGSPRRLLLMLLGDYWWQRTEFLPSAALVALLGEFGVGDAAARAALSRLVRHDLLMTRKVGRRTFYALSERAMRVLDVGGRRLFGLGRESAPWSGEWSVIAFSLPESRRQVRDALRDRLRWLGFAPLYDGVWVSPHDNLAAAVAELAGLGIGTATAFRSRTFEGSPQHGLPQHAWDLAELRAGYEEFIEHASKLRDRLTRGDLAEDEALVARMRLVDEWRMLLGLDPDLPQELLPTAWPLTEAYRVFVATYDELGPLACRRVRHVLRRFDPCLAELATHHGSRFPL
jgi:phenylacetic acid degradation operon negative regulatory protein